MIFSKENVEFPMNLISICYVTKAYFVWSGLEYSLKTRLYVKY